MRSTRARNLSGLRGFDWLDAALSRSGGIVWAIWLTSSRGRSSGHRQVHQFRPGGTGVFPEELMSYIKHVLQPGEAVRYQGSVHWILYLPAILLAFAAVAIGAVTFAVPWRYGWLPAIACLVAALILAVRAWWVRWITEIVVTDRRVIYVHGFIQRELSRNTHEPDRKRRCRSDLNGTAPRLWRRDHTWHRCDS